MKQLIIILYSLLMASCTVNAQSSVRMLTLVGDSLPSIRHITDMKIHGDTLYFVYETEDGFGQRILRKAIIDKDKATLNIGQEIGKRDGGSYVSYMPYIFFDINDKAHVVSQDDCQIFDLSDDVSMIRTKEYLIKSNSLVPFPISLYVQDIFMTSPHKYIFIGREPNGGAQYVMSSNIETERIDTIRKITISEELQAWMPNAGELAYSRQLNRMAFAYRLHPVIDIYDMNGRIINQLRLASDTFDDSTLDEADFEELNPIHTVDVTTSTNDIYALYLGRKYADINSNSVASLIYRLNWNGNVISQYKINATLYRIAYYDENMLIGWNGNDFIEIFLKP